MAMLEEPNNKRYLYKNTIISQFFVSLALNTLYSSTEKHYQDIVVKTSTQAFEASPIRPGHAQLSPGSYSNFSVAEKFRKHFHFSNFEAEVFFSKILANLL